MNSSAKWRGPRIALALSAVAALAAAGCSSSGGSSGGGGGKGPAAAPSGLVAPTPGQPDGSATGTPKQGGVVKVAEAAGASPTAIWPYVAPNQALTVDINQFQYFFYRPLYFWGTDDQIKLDYSNSPAGAAVWSSDGLTVTVPMAGWKWSDGSPVDAKSVLFWMNMLEAEKAQSAYYTPPNPSIGADYFPDNVASYSGSGNTVVFHLKHKVSESWFVDNQLSSITPLPRAQDVTGPGQAGHCEDAAPGNVAADTAACAPVYKYLSGQSTNITGWASNPVWSVVDGPWKLKSANSNGAYSVVPNTNFSGSHKPHLDEVDFVPFTKDTTEYTALSQGNSGINLGYIPWQSAPTFNSSNPNAGNPLASKGYTILSPTFLDSIGYYSVNDANKQAGPLFKQGYFMNAIQRTVDQGAMIKGVYHGWAYPSYGPVPIYPSGNEVSPGELNAQLSYDPNAAMALLKAHGWDTSQNPAVCTSPGTGPNQCGAGIAQGQKAQFTLEYPKGVSSSETEVAAMKDGAKKAHIAINLNGVTQNQAGNDLAPCDPKTGQHCDWQAILYGGWVYAPDYKPTGDVLFATGAGSNAGSYSDPQADKLMLETTRSDDPQAMYNYEDYMLAHPAVIMEPNWLAVDVVSPGLHIGFMDPFQGFQPEDWYYVAQ
jgi:peptide/nickel transport system substrate-binding protein